MNFIIWISRLKFFLSTTAQAAPGCEQVLIKTHYFIMYDQLICVSKCMYTYYNTRYTVTKSLLYGNIQTSSTVEQRTKTISKKQPTGTWSIVPNFGIPKTFLVANVSHAVKNKLYRNNRSKPYYVTTLRTVVLYRCLICFLKKKNWCAFTTTLRVETIKETFSTSRVLLYKKICEKREREFGF